MSILIQFGNGVLVIRQGSNEVKLTPKQVLALIQEIDKRIK